MTAVNASSMGRAMMAVTVTSSTGIAAPDCFTGVDCLTALVWMIGVGGGLGGPEPADVSAHSDSCSRRSGWVEQRWRRLSDSSEAFVRFARRRGSRGDMRWSDSSPALSGPFATLRQPLPECRWPGRSRVNPASWVGTLRDRRSTDGGLKNGSPDKSRPISPGR